MDASCHTHARLGRRGGAASRLGTRYGWRGFGTNFLRGRACLITLLLNNIANDSLNMDWLLGRVFPYPLDRGQVPFRTFLPLAMNQSAPGHSFIYYPACKQRLDNWVGLKWEEPIPRQQRGQRVRWKLPQCGLGRSPRSRVIFHWQLIICTFSTGVCGHIFCGQ